LSNRAPLVEKLVWIYIYVGLLLLGLGLAVQRSDATIGWVIAGIGIASTVVGIVLIWVRSRMKAGPP
jgi:formate hydrogenlyase subunit 3/multisubunit Na+/H+ antiporter MnhD subunit